MDTPKATAPDRMFCVKCGDEHNKILCTKDPTAPATCALCDGEQPASYKGCVIYKNLQQARDKTHCSNHPTATQTSTPPVNINDALPYKLHPLPAPEPPPFPSPSPYSYIATHHQQPINLAEQLSTFHNEFKTMFGQLIQQNGLILNMLNTVIQKLTTQCPSLCV